MGQVGQVGQAGQVGQVAVAREAVGRVGEVWDGGAMTDCGRRRGSGRLVAFSSPEWTSDRTSRKAVRLQHARAGGEDALQGTLQ